MRSKITRFSQKSAVIGVLVVGIAAAAGRAQTPAPTTVFEGARVITGTGGRAIENATLVVTGGRIVQLGGAADVKAPQGAARVSLAGKTVMPTIIDTHVHLSTTRDALVTDLRQRAYFGVSAAMSLGLDAGPDVFQVRAQPPAGVARLLHRRTRHHVARARPHRRAVLGHDRSRGTQGRPGTGRAEGGPHQDLGGRSRRQVHEAALDALHADHRRSTQAPAFGWPRTSSICPTRRACSRLASMSSPMASATSTPMTTWCRSSRRTRTWCSFPTCPIAAWRRTTAGCAAAFPTGSWRRSRPPPPTARRRRRRSASRRAI